MSRCIQQYKDLFRYSSDFFQLELLEQRLEGHVSWVCGNDTLLSAVEREVKLKDLYLPL
jgi:hypothetical protein